VEIESAHGADHVAHSYSPSRTYPNAAPGRRCGASTAPGACVTSTIVAFAFFPSSVSTRSFWKQLDLNAPLPCPPCCARAIPPAVRVQKTIANRASRMTFPPIEPERVRHAATRMLKRSVTEWGVLEFALRASERGREYGEANCIPGTPSRLS